MQVVKGNLDGTRTIDIDSVYLVDWSKLEKIEDLILILAAIGFSFSPAHPQFKNIEHLLNLDNPIKIGNQQAVKEAQEKKINLPKLKTIK
jgi:hypothetical protein